MAKAKAKSKAKPKAKGNAKAKAKPKAKVKAKAKAKPAAKKVAAKAKKAAANVVAKAKKAAANVVAKAKKAAANVVAKAKKAAAPAKRPAAAKAASTPAPSEASGPRLAPGSPAPRFELKDQAGKVVSSDALRGAPYVLYFYPKDDTSGCTREACGFRDAGASFGKLGAKIIGVSPDSEASHARFAEKYGLPFTLLADPDKVLAKAYGAWALKKNYGREYMGILRSTFVVDGKGVVQRAFYGVKVDGHVDKVLDAVGSA